MSYIQYTFEMIPDISSLSPPKPFAYSQDSGTGSEIPQGNNFFMFSNPFEIRFTFDLSINPWSSSAVGHQYLQITQIWNMYNTVEVVPSIRLQVREKAITFLNKKKCFALLNNTNFIKKYIYILVHIMFYGYIIWEDAQKKDFLVVWPIWPLRSGPPLDLRGKA